MTFISSSKISKSSNSGMHNFKIYGPKSSASTSTLKKTVLMTQSSAGNYLEIVGDEAGINM